MALSRTETGDGLLAELRTFEQLVRSLSPAQLDTPSRCEGWTVGDVARHVIGTMADVSAGRLEGLGSPEVTAREVGERAGHDSAQLADECAAATNAAVALLSVFDDASWQAPAGGGYDGTIGDGVEALWYDTWLHADDIRAAIGLPSITSDCGALRCALSHVQTALEKHAWSGTIPASSEPTAFEFVLTATGRSDGSSLGTNAPLNIYA